MFAVEGNADGSSQKKRPRVRGLTSLSAIRKELVRVYSEAREAGPDPARVSYYRALCYILNAAAQVRKDEALEDIEKRVNALEEMRK